MDYEKAYKEALGRAKEEMSKQGMKNDVTANHLVGVIFPELKESEDETIRKKLLKLFNDMERDDSILDDYSLDKVRTIKWLEKQKESSDPLEKVSKEAFKNIPSVNPEVFKMPKITGITWGGGSLNDFYLDEGKNWKVQFDNGKSEKEERLIDKLKDLPMEYPLYSPQYGVIYLAEVDRVDDIITCYKHKLPEGATRTELEQEDTVSFYGDGEAGDEDFNVSKEKQLYLFEELFSENNNHEGN